MKRILLLAFILIFLFTSVGCKKNVENTSSVASTTSGIIFASDPDADNESDNISSGEDNSSTDSDTESETDSTTDNSGEENDTNTDTSSSDTSADTSGSSKPSTDNNNTSHTTSNGNENSNNTDNSSSDKSDSSIENSSESESSNQSDTNSNTSSNGSNQNTSGNVSSSNSTSQESNSGNGSGNESNTDKQPTSSNDSGNYPDPKPQQPDEDYTKIECRKVSDNEWKNVELVSNSNKLYIALTIPSDWEIKDDGFIYKKGLQIGTISSKAPGTALEIFESGSKNEGTVLFKKSVEKHNADGLNVFKRIFKASEASVSGANNLHITVNYSELDNHATEKVFNSLSHRGIDRKVPEIKNESKKFLILGNSFISSSMIGEFLSDMLITDGAKYAVETKNISSAEVSDFASDTTLINSIKNGEYAYVLQCGFYTDEKSWGSADTEGPLKKIIDACSVSDTGLIVFPAHNESAPVINRALEKYTDLYCINWKSEIDNLINSGIGESSPTSLTVADFCENDELKHSTPLAGYVGAHMIFRNIFGTVPPVLSATAPLSMTDINAKLNNYPLTGIVPGKSIVYKYYI